MFTPAALAAQFRRNGFVHVPGFLDKGTLATLQRLSGKFHQQWLRDNQGSYTNGAVNSAFLTDGRYLTPQELQTLFSFIGSNTLVDVVSSVLPNSRTFLNTQLFFDPKDNATNNYWHRDPQYHLNEEQQQAVLENGPEVIHCRVALRPEHGIELIPASHKQWDSTEERTIRLQLNGHKNHEELSSSVAVPLAMGDLLVFSANMIHRGLYGLDRLALDVLFCEDRPETQHFINQTCLPDQEQRVGIDVPGIFHTTTG